MRFAGFISLQRRGELLHATLSRPPDNRLDAPLRQAVSDLIRFFDHDGAARVLLLSSGLPGHFAVGDDAPGFDPGGGEPDGLREELDAALERLARCGRPSIAVLDGVASGTGLLLALACTLRFAGAGARLSLPQIAGGTIPAAGGTQRLPHLVGRGHALELMLSGREIAAEEAARIGLVDRLLAAEPLAESLAVAEILATRSSAAVAGILSCVDAARDLPHADGLAVERVAVAATAEDIGAERIAAAVAPGEAARS